MWGILLIVISEGQNHKYALCLIVLMFYTSIIHFAGKNINASVPENTQSFPPPQV